MKTVAQYRRARFDYEITETLEAGIVLTGQEVKSCRGGHVQLAGSFVSLRGGAPILKGMKIAPYVYAGPQPDYDPERDRTLLLKKSDIERLKAAEQEKGITVIPLEVRSGRHIKVLIGIGRGRKRLDKRARIRERDVQKKLRRGEEI